ncbi:MAG: hypothetical protein KME55_29795 [Nostoc indistinguendum CM1-VF10]|jgi:WD40 repeat protein|nr:hypothetical protein [Nostoc indistinguendum CM1-VF10]
MSNTEQIGSERNIKIKRDVRESILIPGDHNIAVITNYYYREDIKVTPVTSDDPNVDDALPCPYRGLFHFGPNDAEFFFGRDVFIEELIQATFKRNFIPVLGASGSGKSSVVLAGLVPKLQQQGCWLFTHFRPGSDPFHALAEALVPLYTSGDATVQIAQARALARYFYDDKVTLPDIFSHIQRQHPNHRLLLIADQFEELYTLCNDEKTRTSFLDTLLSSFQTSSSFQSPPVLVATMRADFLGNGLSYPAFGDLLQNTDIKIRSMNHSELLQVIVKPAEKVGITFEAGLEERILNDVEDKAGNLPLLEFTLMLLWQQRTGKQLTHAAYDAIGKVQGALAHYADEIYDKLNAAEQEQVRRIFIQLVRPGEGTEDTLRLATKAELGETSWGLVSEIANARLVVTSRNTADQETVEVVHEALIHNWGQLRQWMETDRTFRAWQERLRVAIQQWDATGRDESALLRGKPLADAQEWLHKRPEELKAEQGYIKASLILQEREKEKLSRQRKRIIVGLTGGLLGALGLAAIAGLGWWQATNAATNDRIKVLIAESRSLFDLSGAKPVSYTKYSSRFTDIPLTKRQQEKEKEDISKSEILFQEAAFKAIKAGQELQHAFGVETGTKFQVLEALQQIVGTKEEPKALTLPECEQFKRGPFSLAWTSNRKMIACINYDGTVRLWDGTTGKKTNTFQGETEWVDDVVFSPNGKMIASGNADGTVNLWDRVTGAKVRELKGHLSQVNHIRFSPDGQTIAAANYDGNIIIWNIATGRELKTLSRYSNSDISDDIERINFSPNGHFLASLSRDGFLILWEVETGTQLKVFPQNDNLDYRDINFSFSPNSQTVIYSSSKSIEQTSVKFWNIAKKNEIKEIFVPGTAFFSPDGKVIAVIDYKNSRDNDLLGKDGKLSFSFTKGTVSLWDTSTGEKVKTLSNFPPGELAEISFSPDNSLIAVETYDNKGGSNMGPVIGSKAKVTLWKRDGARLKTIEQLGELFQINFSPDSRKVAISSFDSKGRKIILKLWDVATGRILKTLIDEPIVFSPEGFAVGLKSRFSPDGKIIVVVSSSGIAKFFDVSTGAELSSPNISPASDIIQRTSADQKSIITLRTDGSLRYQDRATGKEFKLNRYDSTLVSAAHISDDKTITTVNWYGKLQQRELTTGRIIKSINLPFDKFASSLKFSPDGYKVAAARSNYTVKIWDVTTGKEIHTLKEHASIADEANDWRRSKLHFSPNGSIVAVLRAENDEKKSTLELWEVSTGKAIQFSKVISGIKSISFSPDSNNLAILKSNDTIQLWKLSTRQLVKTIRPTINNIWGIQFSPDSKLFFAFSSNTLKMLNILAGREIASFKLPSGTPVNPSIDFSSDGKTLILQSGNKFSFLNFNLDDLIKRSCNITRNYLKNNPSVSKNDKHICDSALEDV